MSANRDVMPLVVPSAWMVIRINASIALKIIKW